MRKTFRSVICIMAATLMMSSCIGSFSLSNGLLAWNKSLNNKFVNELVFLIISPAYAFCSVADALVLNTVEFWTGSNPISKVGHVENVWGQDGKQYAVKTMKNGYEITKPTGDKVNFVYNKKANSWSIEADGQQMEMFRFNNDGTIQASLPNGNKMNVSLNQEGMYSLRMAINNGTFFAAR